MSKIKYPQLVKDVADAIRTGTKTTDLIPVGELADTILALLTRVPASGVTDFEYKSITYNDDDTITLIDQDDVEHTMVCEYDGNKISSIALDGETLLLEYAENELVSIENTTIDLSLVESSGQSDSTDEQLELVQALVGDVTSIQEELEVASAMLGGK